MVFMPLLYVAVALAGFAASGFVARKVRSLWTFVKMSRARKSDTPNVVPILGRPTGHRNPLHTPPDGIARALEQWEDGRRWGHRRVRWDRAFHRRAVSR